MIWLIAMLAAGAPKGFDPDDISLWEGRARTAVTNAGGTCWRLSGSVRVNVKLFQPATSFSAPGETVVVESGTFEAVYDKGEWTRFLVDLKRDGQPAGGDLLVGSVLGRAEKGVLRTVKDEADAAAGEVEESEDGQVEVSLSGGSLDVQTSGGQAASVLGKLVDGALTESPTTSYVMWDKPTKEVVFVLEAAIEPDKPNDLLITRVRFPRAAPLPTAIDATLPDKVTVGDGLVRARVLSLQLHVRGQDVDGQFLPSIETLSGAVGALGFTVGYEQTVVYREARACE